VKDTFLFIKGNEFLKFFLIQFFSFKKFTVKLREDGDEASRQATKAISQRRRKQETIQAKAQAIRAKAEAFKAKAQASRLHEV
jgi:hypothetical protein